MPRGLLTMELMNKVAPSVLALADVVGILWALWAGVSAPDTRFIQALIAPGRAVCRAGIC